jgi:hypothetical protein
MNPLGFYSPRGGVQLNARLDSWQGANVKQREKPEKIDRFRIIVVL